MPKYLTLEQSIDLLNSVDGPDKERDYCILTLFLNCGMRLSELVGINVTDVRHQASCIRIVGKGDKERIIYLNEACIDAIDRYLAVRPKDGLKDKDAYSGYNAVSGVKRCLCYTHLRRAFVDALPKDIYTPEASKPAEAILRLNELFNIESELEALSPDQKKNERLIREKPLLEAFWSWAEKSAIGELPKSKLSKALHYALNNREGFFHYLEDGNCSISNSLAENCIRPFVIGRKNWLFSGSPKGAEASAGIYTLVETAKANGLAPLKYIKYILSDMPGSAFLEHPEYLDDYLPWNPLVKEFCR